MSGAAQRKVSPLRGRKPEYMCPHAERMDNMETRISALEGVYDDINDVKKIVQRIWRAIKWGAPSIITAAVTAGYINGNFAILLKAVFN